MQREERHRQNEDAGLDLPASHEVINAIGEEEHYPPDTVLYWDQPGLASSEGATVDSVDKRGPEELQAERPGHEAEHGLLAITYLVRL